MTLIQSISGTRGTIGGPVGQNLTPIDIVRISAAYGQFILQSAPENNLVIVGRDARISGAMVSNLLINTLIGLGLDVVDLGLSTTPTVELAVPAYKAAGGVIITASHNPKEWNALKFLDQNGEFLDAAAGQIIIELATELDVRFASVDKLGKYTTDDTWIKKHIDMILALPDVAVDAIKAKAFTVVVDPVNSSGAIAVPMLLESLGCKCILINGEANGEFAHNPEPLPEHLNKLSQEVTQKRAHLGIAVDPDVDRVAFVCEDGDMFGEEYTLVAVAKYIHELRGGGNSVSNLSSTQALRDVTRKHGGEYFGAAVGEVNVVTKMKEVDAVIGGEGNGGVIYPPLHYGRDALVGIALFLSLLAKKNQPVSHLRNDLPDYYISKNKVVLPEDADLNAIFEGLKAKYKKAELNTIDGLKIHLDNDWIHLRQSNTEPIIRIYAESTSKMTADHLAAKIQSDISTLLKEILMQRK